MPVPPACPEPPDTVADLIVGQDQLVERVLLLPPTGELKTQFPQGIPRRVDVALRDGSTIQVRPVVPSDRTALWALFTAMSPDSSYFRACGILRAEQLADWSIDLDYHDRYGVVATLGHNEEIVAHAAYVRMNATRAEVAFEVADAMHGHGIGTLLLAQLAGVAATHGIREFSAEVMPANHKMLEVFHASGFQIRQEETDGLTELIFDTAMTAEAMVRFDQREREAARAALRFCLEPQSVAVIGASSRPGTLGSELMANLLASAYPGKLYPINHHRHSVCGIPAFSTIGTVPRRVDMAVVLVPENQLIDVAHQCAEAGVRALVVVSAFAETNTGDAPGHDELLEVCRAAGMRLIGPNSLGVLNTDPAAPLNASLIRSLPARGPVALMSQSGGVGVALTASAGRLDLGLSTVVSVGDKADISGNDLLAYWDEDPATAVILLYLESFGNPRRFARTARHVSARKPILAVKSGVTTLGSAAEGSTTASLLASSDMSVDALFRQAGVIRTDSTGELLEAASLLATQPAPAGDRVVLVTNSRGPAQLCADACRRAGLRPVEEISLSSRASADDYGDAVGAAAASGHCDAVIALFVPSLGATAREVADAVDAVVAHSPAMTFATVLMDRMTAPRPSPGRRHAARFMFPEEAARALGHAADWSLWRARPRGVSASPGAHRFAQARIVIARALAAGPGWLSDTDVHELLDCYGLAPASGLPAPEEDHGLHAPAEDQPFLAGVVHDADFGPLLVCGRPGAEIAVRITPVSDTDAQEMVTSLQNPVWDHSGSASLANATALTSVLLRLGALVEAHAEIEALDLNPLWIGPTGARVGTAKVCLANPPPVRPTGALR